MRDRSAGAQDRGGIMTGIRGDSGKSGSVKQ